MAFLSCLCSLVSSSTTLLPLTTRHHSCHPVRKNDLLNTLDLLYSHKVISDLFCFPSTFIYKRLSWQLLLNSLKNTAPGTARLFLEDSRAVTQQNHASVFLSAVRSLLGREISHNTYSTGDFPVQIWIIQSAFALFFSTTSLPISSGQTTDIWKVTDSSQNFSSKGGTNSSMILV